MREPDVRVQANELDWDVLEHLSIRAEERGHPLHEIPADGEAIIGSRIGFTHGGEMLYHHGYGTRLNSLGGLKIIPEGVSGRNSRKARSNFFAG